MIDTYKKFMNTSLSIMAKIKQRSLQIFTTKGIENSENHICIINAHGCFMMIIS